MPAYFFRFDQQFRRWVSAILLCLGSSIALAQSASEPLFTFTIGAKPLAAALVDFSRVTRQQVSADAASIEGIVSKAINGELTARGALQAMIANSGLELVTVNGSNFALRPGDADRPEAISVASIEEVIVFGTKRNLSLQDTQVSVALVTKEDIEEQVLFNVEDVLLRTANVSTAGGDLNNLSIRGVTLGGVGFTGTGATANIYVDGSPNSFNANQGASNLWDIGQVEVLRGPQSTIQGRNALAGAIVISTADPTYDLEADLRLLAGNENLEQYSGMLNVPLIDETLALRLAVDYREVDFEVLNVDTNNNTRFQQALTARAKLLWEPTEKLRVEFGYQYVDTEFGEFNQTVAPGPVGTPEFVAFDPFGDITYGLRERFEFNEVSRTILDINYDLNANWNLYALATYEDSQRDTSFGALGDGDAPDETYQLELRAAFDYGRLNGWIGAYYFDTEGTFQSLFTFDTTVFGLPSVPSDAVVLFDTEQEDSTENRAVFFDVTYRLNDQWSINLGARYDEEEFTDTGTAGEATAIPDTCIIDPNVPGFGGAPCTGLFPPQQDSPTNAEFDAFLPRGALIYRFNDLQSLSFTVARGYRAGGSYLRVVPGEAVEQLTFDPEYLTNYEFAYRSQLQDRSLTLNANLYYSQWEDQQVSLPGPSGLVFDTLILNSGESDIYGLEIELRKSFNERLELFVAAGFANTEFQDFPFAVDSNGNPSNPDDPRFA
ncbi:MAG: TonB-dependent receptor, partial [Pseudomonadota bacterium]